MRIVGLEESVAWRLSSSATVTSLFEPSGAGAMIMRVAPPTTRATPMTVRVNTPRAVGRPSIEAEGHC